jgi:hypothetical protein
MPVRRFPRFGKRTAVAAVVLLLLGIFGSLAVRREPREIDRSRGLRLGMTQREVQEVMQSRYQRWFHGTSARSNRWLVFGESTIARLLTMNAVRRRLGVAGSYPIDFEDWPVRVRLDSEGRVDRIERGSEVEQAGR